ncbi:MAG: Wzz/FepE/Etk N-terminal domain-containing protein [Chloroflexota bacterium]
MQATSDFWVYISVILKRLWLIVLIVLVTEGVIVSLSYTAKPVYRATVRLQVLATDSSDVSLFTQYRGTTSINEIQQAQNDFIRALKRGFVAWQTIADLNLEIGATDLLAGLSTTIEGDFIVVMVESDDPGRAEEIAMAQVNNALEYYRIIRATPSRVLRQFVAEQLAGEQAKLAESQTSLLVFRQQHNLDTLEQETRSLQDLLRGLKLERDRTVIERERARVYAELYRREQAKALAKVAEIGEMKKDGEPAAPLTLKFWEDIARDHEAVAIRYEGQRDGQEAAITIYDAMIAERTKDLQGLLGLYDEYNGLTQNLARVQANYSFLRDKENEARLKQIQAERLGYIQITEPARKPDAPVQSRLVQLLLVGGAVSVLTGIVLAFMLEFLATLRESARRQMVR